MLQVIGPLTDPTAHGGKAEDAFDLVIPSIPGYGFSSEPTERGWESSRTAQDLAELMERLGYTRFVAQGGDVGAAVSDAMGRQAPAGLVAVHTNLFVPALAGVPLPKTPRRRRPRRPRWPTSGLRGSATSSRWRRDRRRSATPNSTRPSRLLRGCSTTTRTATTRSPAPSSTGEPTGNLTRDHILDNVTLYWLTGTGASAARSYWESAQTQAAAAAAGTAPPPMNLPFGFTSFPGEIWKTPRSWVELAYPNVVYYNEVDKGGHFAAWEEPQLFSEEIRAAFRTVR